MKLPILRRFLPSDNFAHSFFGRLLLVLIFAVLVPLLGLGLSLTRTGEEAIKATVLQDHQQIVRRAAVEIETFLREPLGALEATARITTNIGSDNWQKQAVLVVASLEWPIFKEISFVDTIGREIINSDPAQPLRNRSQEQAFIQGMKGGKYLSEMTLVERGLPAMTVSVPVKKTGMIEGVLIARLDARGIWDVIDRIIIGDTGTVSVFSKEGFWVAHPDKSQIFKEKAKQAESIRKTVPDGFEGREVFAGQVRDNICAVAPAMGSDWVVVSSQSAEEALEIVRGMNRQHRFFLIIGSVLSILIAYGIAYSVSRPIQTLSQGVKRVSNGDFAALPETKRQDEIGELTTSFNHMAISLRDTLANLQAANDFRERIVESIPVGLVVLDRDMMVRHTNVALLKVMGYRNSEEMAGKDIAEILGLEARLTELIKSGLEGESLQTKEMRIKTLDGREIEAVITVAPFFGPSSEIEGLLLLLQDITNQRSLERQLIQSEKLASVGLITAGISHELRNPLNNARWAISEIEDLLTEKHIERVEECIGSVKESIRRCSVIIGNLLDFARPSPKQREKMNIGTLLDSVLLLSEEQIRNNKIEIKRQYKATPQVEGNVDLMKEVFINLATNAVQAMPDGGVLDVVVEQIRPDRLRIIVSDTGCGIPERDIGNVFTPFFTVREGGTGLGLWVAYSGVRGHGGDIRVESQEGKGSKFIVELPVGEDG